MRKLGKTYIETIVEVPTKFQNGRQYAKFLRTWTAIPHEVIDPALLKKLHDQVELTEAGHIELLIEAKNHHGAPRYHKLRGIIEHHIFIGKESK